MAEYLELVRVVIEERASADTTIFQKQCICLWPRLSWRKLRKTFDCFPRSRQIFKELAQTLRRQGESAARSAEPNFLSLNEIQCSQLWGFIREVYDYMSSKPLPASHHKIHEVLPEVFREFHVLVTRANSGFVQQFTSVQSWLQAAIFPGNQRLAFEELIVALQTCVSVFDEIIVPVEPSATIWKEAVDMESGANSDAINLRSRIEEVLARPDLGEDERILTHYLLESMSNSDNHEDVDLPEFFIAKGAYPTEGKQIDKGASGEVLKVKWLGMTCAKKVYLDVTDNQGSMQKDCTKEVCIMAKLNHHRIVKLLCTSDPPENSLSFLMEFMPMSLYKFIEERRKHHKGGILPAAAIDIMLQISQGIEYLHDEDIVHRDVKSPNVLVSPSASKKLRDEGYVGDVKMTDFGLAWKAPGLTKPSQEKMGTTCWMAPEVFAGDELVDWKKADAYSFAMTCTEILTGYTPFHSRPRSELKTRITNGERPILPSSCPEALVSLLKLCWATTPTDRPYFSQIREELTSIKRYLLTGSLKWPNLDYRTLNHAL
ncbi:hypothetical protein KC19_1G255000 [Ceratodon purpureus]|uniref:Protein kinase domain-containing protein n=1 Tax=Ceratodon purpureus TaxID=3225 RepID=A0A8T0JAE0_CERPU|nr:hypothetical protein KC19_1G255000 [Ceratodon purpureus]